MNSEAFVRSVQQKLDPIAPIVLPGIIRKQILDIGATERNLTPQQAEQLIERVKEALEMFMGPSGTQLVHQIMIRELRRYAPEYFEQHALI